VVVRDLGWPIVDRLSSDCNFVGNQCDFFNSEGQPYYSDYGHWSKEGAKFFGKKLFHVGFEERIKNLDFMFFSVESITSE